MKTENILKAISVMERAKEKATVVMTHWQTPRINDRGGRARPATTEDELHACGNKACFAGCIAVSPEFIADGGFASFFGGAPGIYVGEHGGHLGVPAIAYWLGISIETADAFIRPGDETFYPVPWKKVYAVHVLEKLKELLDIGEPAFKEKYKI